ncbi:pituitary adenylate cyclase-activating polypeptide type I receptor-like [Leucoraja erinacea]|uniref:pituitary adenylate cyclase-activating polypeptide type I receptor-like n=1 Tax=Leucoraja erinaceus TaxID=7782 RepID=UPI0024543269|nr:pituitary adenylate cyclase-activating polypeptide type I receptor-like [Leucoraja erinacea]
MSLPQSLPEYIAHIFLHLALCVTLHQPIASTLYSCTEFDEYWIVKSKCNYTQMEDFNSTDFNSTDFNSTDFNSTPGCPTWWDNMICWPASSVGEVVNRTCPSYLHLNHNGVLYRTCTENGWSKLTPGFEEACNFTDTKQNAADLNLKPVYTAGYATSLIALVTAIIIFTVFRKLHCTRNYIHMNLFLSFILRSMSVIIKDIVILSSDTDYCTMSKQVCRSVIVVFHYCILANFWWLLVEGLYLQTLLSLAFVVHAKYFWCYCLIGWGTPTVVLIIWIIAKLLMDDVGCWDNDHNVYIWWIIKGAGLLSVLVNFLIFLNIIRILIQKLGSRDVGGKSHSQFSRLTKSTLLLIPLLGVHYIVCAFLPDNVAKGIRFFIELGLGSFQGFVVALLYCFLNTEVMSELKRQARLFCPEALQEFTARRKRSTLAESTSTQVTLLEKLGQRSNFIEHDGQSQSP